MKQEDYILREIEKISVLIMGLIGRLTRRQEKAKINDEDSFTRIFEDINSEMNLDIDMLLLSDPEEFKGIFTLELGFDSRNTELVADLMKAISEICFDERKQAYLNKALEIYNYVDRETKTFSIDRMAKVEEIRTRLSG